MLDIRYRILILLLSLPIFVTGCTMGVAQQRTGPELSSEYEAINLAKEKVGLTDINSVELTTAGPIYRLILGKDNTQQEKAVWVDKSIVFSINLKDGVSRHQVQEVLRQQNLDSLDQLQLIYVPDNIKNSIHSYLKKSSSNIFWWAKSSNGEVIKQIFFDFYDGSVVFES